MTYHDTSFAAKVIKGGKVVIPAELRRRHNFADGEMLVFDEDDDGVVRLRSYKQVLRDLQAWGRTLRKPGVSIVDELVADRRAEAARESLDD